MELDLRELEIILSIKNGIINATKEEMIEDYSNLENYNMLIKGLNILLENEKAFFLLEDNYIEKTLDVINKKRNDYKAILNNEINKVIIGLNSLKTVSKSKKSEMLYEYIKKEESKRSYTLLSFKELEKSMAYDVIALTALETDDIKMISNIKLYLHSINYLLNEIPALFIDDAIFMTCKKSLKIIKENSNIFKINNILLANSFENELESNKELIL